MNINLTKPELGQFEIISFPDGQQDIKMLNPQHITNYLMDSCGDSYNMTISITSRMNSFKDLELILCIVTALRRLGAERLILNIPYILGARSDRQFVKGGTSYLVDVIAPLLNSCNFTKVYSFDTHSDVAAACIKNLEVRPNWSMVRYGIDQLGLKPKDCTIVSPDAGALKKIYDVMSYINISDSEACKLAIGMKHRDVVTGKILNTDVILPKEEEGNMAAKISNYIIVDDICDGGRTFIELSKVLREKDCGCKVHLIVSHGVFSQGIDILLDHLDGIVTTDSIRPRVSNEKIHYYPIIY